MVSGEQTLCLVGGQADLVTSDHDLQVNLETKRTL